MITYIYIYIRVVFRRVVFYEYFKYLFACPAFVCARKKVLYLLFGSTRIKGHVFIFIIVILHRFQMTWTANEKKKLIRTINNNNTATDDW